MVDVTHIGDSFYLNEFNDGYKAGWDGAPFDKARSGSYKVAYGKAQQARREAAFYAGKESSKND